MVFFFFKQKTAYEMRISDWSSDVCSSDLFIAARVRVPGVRDDPVVASVHLMSPLAGGANTFAQWNHRITAAKAEFADWAETAGQIGRASCRERVWQSV